MTSMWSRTKEMSSRIFRRRRSSCNHGEEESSSTVPSVQVIENTSLNSNTVTSDTDRLPLLYHVAKTWAWAAVEFRCQTHPEEASAEYQDEAGDTCLHWVCFGNPPLRTVTALLSTCPELAACPNNEGTLPIHVACSYRASGDIIRALVRAYPEGAGTRDRSGSFPLHILCDFGSSLDSLRAILETKQGMATLDKIDGVYRRTSLLILNARKSMTNFHRDVKILRRARAREIIHGHEQDDHAFEHAPLRSMEFWRKASLLVWLEYNKHNSSAVLDCLERNENEDEHDSMIETCIVHACVGLPKCHLSLLTFAMLLHPQQLLVPDATNGQLPLHIAASQPDTSRLLDVLSSSPRCAASVFDQNGNLPVMLAIQSGKKWREGVGALLAAYPAALEVMFLDDALYPYIWSKLLQLQHHNGASCLYESIRAKPNIVKGFGDY